MVPLFKRFSNFNVGSVIKSFVGFKVASRVAKQATTKAGLASDRYVRRYVKRNAERALSLIRTAKSFKGDVEQGGDKVSKLASDLRNVTGRLRKLFGGGK